MTRTAIVPTEGETVSQAPCRGVRPGIITDPPPPIERLRISTLSSLYRGGQFALRNAFRELQRGERAAAEQNSSFAVVAQKAVDCSNHNTAHACALMPPISPLPPRRYRTCQPTGARALPHAAARWSARRAAS